MVELASRTAAELRQPTLLWQASSMGTSRLILQGDLDGRAQLADDTLELGRHANREGEALLFYNEQILEIRRWQDQLSEVIVLLREFAGSDTADFGYALTRYLYDAHDDAQASACYTKIIRELQLPHDATCSRPRHCATSHTLRRGSMTAITPACCTRSSRRTHTRSRIRPSPNRSAHISGNAGNHPGRSRYRRDAF